MAPRYCRYRIPPRPLAENVLPAGRVLRLPPVSPLLDEDARLPCRHLMRSACYRSGEHTDGTSGRLCFGGLFAYDPHATLKRCHTLRLAITARTTALFSVKR